METTIITELVTFLKPDSTTEEQLVAGVNSLNEFQRRQDGFVDSELVKSPADNRWHLIFHFENMEKVRAIGDKMRAENVLAAFTPLLIPGSLAVTFHQQVKRW
ncbi:MAG TPA: hypothetical protein PKG48_14965 [Bacteroidales bacterium]|nr:hypothetical protein [Bacteroidales bacterium]